MRPRIRSLVAVLALAPCAALAGQAKGRIELTPFVGMYAPVADIIQLSDPSGSGLTLTFSQKSAFTFGVRLGYGISDRAALEGAFGYTASDVKVEIGGFGSVALGGTVMQGSARVRYRLNAPTSATGWHLIGGLAMISRGGEVWDSLQTGGLSVDGRTDVGAVIGGGVTLPVGKKLALRIDVEDYIHQAKFTLNAQGTQQDTESQLQNDLVLSVGLAIQLGGR
jgi:hypothetical protein